MKRALLLLIILIRIVSFVAPALAMQNEPEGFRGIPWSTPAPKNNFLGFNKLGLVLDPQLKILSKAGYDLPSELRYTRKKESLTLGGATLSRIEYTFLEGLGFCRVGIQFHGDENFNLIRRACVDSWGPPDEETLYKESMQTNIFWRSEKILVSMYYSHKFPSVKTQGTLNITLITYFDASEKAREMNKQRERGF